MSSLAGIKGTIAREGARNTAAALRSSTAIGWMAIGAFGMLPLVPDWIYAYEGFAHLLTGDDGELSTWSNVIATASATGGMVGIVWAIHKWFAPVLENPTSRWYFIFAMLCLGIVTANPMMSLLENSNLIGGGIGNSSGADSLAWSGVMVQSALFPVCAVIGTLGFGIFSRSLNDWREARKADRDAKRQIAGVGQILAAEKEADLTRSELDALEARMKRQFRMLMHAAAMALAKSYELYLQGKAPAPNRSTFNQQLDDVFEGVGTQSKELRAEVADHMPELLPIESLPQDGSTLPAAAKKKIRTYVRWIKREYSRTALRAAV